MSRVYKFHGCEAMLEEAGVVRVGGVVVGSVARVQYGMQLRWQANGRGAYGSRREAVKHAVAAHLGRTQDIESAHYIALAEDATRQRQAEHKAAKRAAREAAVAAEQHRRATQPMLVVVRHEADSEWSGARAGEAHSVHVYGGSERVEITMSLDWDTRRRVAEVNWTAFGSVSVAFAREYAMAMLRAADEAEAINRTRAEA